MPSKSLTQLNCNDRAYFSNLHHSPKFVGIFQVVQRKGKVAYMVEDLPSNRKRRIQRRFTAHVSQLRKWNPREMEETADDSSNEKENLTEIEDEQIIVGEWAEYQGSSSDSEVPGEPDDEPLQTTRCGRTTRFPSRFKRLRFFYFLFKLNFRL